MCTSLETITLGTGIKKVDGDFLYLKGNSKGEYVKGWGDCPALKVINVPAKKADYYKKRLPEELHHLIVELPPVKKVKK